VARVDFLVGDRVVVEFDGRVKYGMDGRRAEDDLWAEKRREDELRALGYIVVRIVWAQLERPDLVAQRVLAALRQAELTVRTPTSH
jgi:very-short-patch-repair endonuclease